MKNCLFCKNDIIPKYASTISPQMGYMQLIPGYDRKSLHIQYEGNRSVRFNINYCPICGKKLDNNNNDITN